MFPPRPTIAVAASATTLLLQNRRGSTQPLLKAVWLWCERAHGTEEEEEEEEKDGKWRKGEGEALFAMRSFSSSLSFSRREFRPIDEAERAPF